MLTFRQFIHEALIKLSGFSNDSNKKSSGFMQDLDDSSKTHPINHKARIIGGAHVHVSPHNGMIHIHDIQSHSPGSGAGTKALEHLKDLADKHAVKLHINAKGYAVTKTSQLKKWYKKHGFTHDSNNSESMTREPNGK